MPLPDAHAQAHTDACAAMLRDEIRNNGGWISFAQFMDRALYAPGLGYYAAGASKFGVSGDFITAPEISSLFGTCVANAIAPTILQTNGDMHGDVLELGPGSGKLAFDTLMALDAQNALPRTYKLLEVSADLRERQRAKLATLPEHLFNRCEWLTELPQHFVGAIVANEVLDVVPTHLVSFIEGRTFERGVALNGDDFIWRDVATLPVDVQEMIATMAEEIDIAALPVGYLTEFAPQALALTTSLVQALQSGVILLIDYGFRRAEFYHPSRNTGTLMCHYRHFAHTNPFLYPGLQDITVHVDFTAIANAAIAQGAELLGYSTQANFLLGAGITDVMAQYDPRDAANYLPITNAAQRLLSPAEMGEFFKVIGFAKGNHSIVSLSNVRQLPL